MIKSCLSCFWYESRCPRPAYMNKKILGYQNAASNCDDHMVQMELEVTKWLYRIKIIDGAALYASISRIKS